MKLMVIGGGGREYAIIKKLKENQSVEKIYCLPGNAGIAKLCDCVEIGATELDKIVAFAIENAIDYAVVTPDDPLVLGLVDMLNQAGIACFGPTKAAAEIEGSKIFAKNLMKKYNIPTADYNVLESIEEAVKFISELKNSDYPIVIKADGLALGKGVTIAYDEQDALNTIKELMIEKKFGASGEKLVIEQFITGPEVSLLCFTDGKVIIPMISVMDHKRIGEGDTGLNTGGMGAIAPNPYYTAEIEKECIEKIIKPTVKAMNQEGRTFKGCLYFGLMITESGVKVIEYNCRFGDPETQVIMPLLQSDLLTIMMATTNGTLRDTTVAFALKSACCVIMASKGYPEKYKKGNRVNYKPSIEKNLVFAGVGTNSDGQLVSSGGRVLGVVAVAYNLSTAVKDCYSLIKWISFSDYYYRKDIGKKALEIVGDEDGK